jgi:phosphatidate cytidylyltransferase
LDARLRADPMNSVPAKESKTRVFFKRTASTLGMWGLVAAGFASRLDWAYLVLIAALMVLASVEYYRMLRESRAAGFPRFGMAAAVAFATASGWFLWADGAVPPGWDGAAVIAVLIGAFGLQLRHPIEGRRPLEAVAFTLAGFVYIALMFGFAARLVFVVPGPGEVPGAMVLLWLVAVTKFTDMGAYILGSAIGRHKMIPRVSPGKTWEGFVGALLFAQLAACGLYAFFGDDMPEFATGLHVLGGWPAVVGLGFGVALLAVIGDLAESVIKRSLGAKDSGHMLPGIGGALDLVDSLCFTAPALYFYLIWTL